MPEPLNSLAWSRFWSRVDASASGVCWEWTGPISHKGGYAQTRLCGKTYTAHRLAWLFTRGNIPDDYVVRHRCDNPKCCNPQHLEVGTHLDNYTDMVTRGRRKLSGAKGERNCKAKLTEELVKEIRVRYTTSDTSTIKLAREYGVTQGLISQIVLHRIWKHVP